MQGLNKFKSAAALIATLMTATFWFPQSASSFVVNSVTITVNPNPFHDSTTVTATFNITHQVWQISAVNVNIRCYDEDSGFRDGDDVLGDTTVTVPFMSQIPTITFTLTCSENGKIQGPDGSSWESETNIYVRAPLFGPKSNMVNVAQTECNIARIGMEGPSSWPVGQNYAIECAIGDTSLLEGVDELAFGINYDSGNFNLLDAAFVHPAVMPFGVVSIVEDTIFFSADLASPTDLTGPIASFDLQIREDAEIGTEYVLDYVGECGFYDSTGTPLVISFYDDHGVTILPQDTIPPLIDPALLAICQFRIVGWPGAVTDDYMELPNDLQVELFDQAGDFVAMRNPDITGSFDMEHFWLEAGTPASLVAYDLLGNSTEYMFIVEQSYLPVFHDAVEGMGPPNGIATVETGFFNRCDLAESYEIMATSQQGWVVNPPGQIVTLDSFTDMQLTFDVEIPPWIAVGETDIITLAAISMTQPTTYFSTDSIEIGVIVCSPIDIVLTPLGTTVFPATGGILDYNIEVSNTSTLPEIVDIWTNVTLPNGIIYGPIIGPLLNFELQPQWSGNRDRQQTIPGNAPAGTYSMNGYLGEYDEINPIIFAMDQFEFEKLETGEGTWYTGWFTDSGESFEELKVGKGIPVATVLHKVYPNPFNPMTTISYSLAEASVVRLSVCDISGRLVATLVDGWRNAGTQDVIFDASQYASGIYFVQIQAGNEQEVQKIILMK